MTGSHPDTSRPRASRPGTSERVCLAAPGYPGSLTVGRTYVVLEDEAALQESMLRVVDDTGESFLYPASWFRK